jgi:hypothetical protein
LLPTVARPIQHALPARIQQRFHLWLDGFDPPAPETSWWKKDYEDALAKDPRMKELADESEAMKKSVNTDIWFDKLAFQPAQAIFGIASGRTTGRGLGLGFPEVIPIADSDYVYAAIAEEMGLLGGALVILAIIIFVIAGIRTSIDARDMFTKLCSAGLTAFIGIQALVNIGGITRALPMTGITLPFVSHGGFSLITSFAMLGMLMAFSNRNARDKVIAEMSQKKYPKTELVRQIPGVGPLTSLAFVLTLDDATRFRRSRDVGSYLGLCPKQSESGQSKPQLAISKAGDSMLRRLLVNCAHYILGRWGPDCDLRRWGLSLMAHGGTNAKKRAVVAVGRKLAIVMHKLLITGEVYEPLRRVPVANVPVVTAA